MDVWPDAYRTRTLVREILSAKEAPMDKIDRIAAILAEPAEKPRQRVGAPAPFEEHWSIRLQCAEMLLVNCGLGDGKPGSLSLTEAACRLAAFVIEGEPAGE